MQKRKITIKSGGEEFQMEVTVEECRIYYRPWWQKKEQRNREAMEENEYMKSLMRGKDGLLEESLDSLILKEKELAVKLIGGQDSVSDYAKKHNQHRTTVSFRRTVVLEKLRKFFKEKGIDV